MYEEKVRKFKCYYCPDCKLYAGSETKIVHGRRMKPNTKYCTGGKKITIFRSDDPKVNVPKWCPKRRVPPTLRIYHFRSPEIEAGENMLAANGISFFPYPSRYAVRYEGESPYTAMDFARQIKKRPLAEKFNSQMQQLFAYIFVHFIAPQQGRQHSLFCWQPVITPILLHQLYHITPFSTIYLYFALFIYPSCRNAQFPQALSKYDLA